MPAYHHFVVMVPERRGEAHGAGVGAAAVGGALAGGVDDVTVILPSHGSKG